MQTCDGVGLLADLDVSLVNNSEGEDYKKDDQTECTGVTEAVGNKGLLVHVQSRHHAFPSRAAVGAEKDQEESVAVQSGDCHKDKVDTDLRQD